MKIAIFGAGGMIGQRIVQEALTRGHEVTAVVRDPAQYQAPGAAVKVVKGDATDASSIVAATTGADVVINSISSNRDGDHQVWVRSAQAFLKAMKENGVPRLIVVGGAGSLFVAPGVRMYDTPEFPAEYRAGSVALGEALEVYRTADFDWLFISPAGYIYPGERTGKYRLGDDYLLTDAQGKSEISAEDYAVGLLDQAELKPVFKRRITIAY